MSSVKFISDLHLGHKNICKFREQFSTVEEHDAYIKDKILTDISKRETLWVLGDIAFTGEAGDWVVELSSKCNLKIVIGNHCSQSKVGMNNMLKYLQAGIKVHGLTTYKEAWLSHCPIHPAEMRKKSMNIHGHTHANNIQDERYFNVSCENVGYKPIRYTEILERMGGNL